jgi:hypothetical protein
MYVDLTYCGHGSAQRRAETAVEPGRGTGGKEADVSLPMTRTALIGAVEYTISYTISSAEKDVVDARYISSGSMAQGAGVNGIHVS